MLDGWFIGGAGQETTGTVMTVLREYELMGYPVLKCIMAHTRRSLSRRGAAEVVGELWQTKSSATLGGLWTTGQDLRVTC